MPNFAASDKQVTDPLVLRQLAWQRIDALGVEFSQDYAHRGLGKGHSPYAKFYRNLNGPEQFMVASGLPMVDGSGDRLTPGWRFQGPHFVAKKNLYIARIQGPDVELVVGTDDAVGHKQGATLGYSPRLFLNSVERFAAAPVLLPIDPWNPGYTENVLEWDYGICKRRLRTVEGRVHGYWIFPADPGGDVLIRYNQTGDYRLKLGTYRQGADEEYIPASVFAAAKYPFEVSDSATYYPDAHPETTSVDGPIRRYDVNETWANIIVGTGSTAYDTATDAQTITMWASSTTNQWAGLYRAIFLFDTSGLSDAATVTAAVLSLHGRTGDGKVDNLVVTPNINIYTSTPALNTSLATGDMLQIQAVAQSTAITYANWVDNAYNDFALNDMTKISLTGVSKFGARNANYDVAGTPPAWSSSGISYIPTFFAEQGGTNRPKLVVTYTLPKISPSMAARLIAAGGL